jgi:hypothetical protein
MVQQTIHRRTTTQAADEELNERKLRAWHLDQILTPLHPAKWVMPFSIGIVSEPGDMDAARRWAEGMRTQPGPSLIIEQRGTRVFVEDPVLSKLWCPVSVSHPWTIAATRGMRHWGLRWMRMRDGSIRLVDQQCKEVGPKTQQNLLKQEAAGSKEASLIINTLRWEDNRRAHIQRMK